VAAGALATIARHRHLLDDANATLMGVSVDPQDAAEGRIAKLLPGVRWFLDHDRAVSRLYGAAEGETYRPHWLLLDPRLRVIERRAIDDGEALFATLAAQPSAAADEEFAPVLVVPRVFEPSFCRQLIDLYERDGGGQSGFMRERDGITHGVVDFTAKRRLDANVTDAALQGQIRARLIRFLLPQIERSFNFKATRVERYIVACYDGDGDGGYFKAHRDNTTGGTAHRRFACTINLNADDYDGGDLVFPEFGRRRYRAPTGGAVVFSCSLLHEATPVTRGRRYAYLPFFYDDAAARQREENAARVAAELQGYRADIPGGQAGPPSAGFTGPAGRTGG
jgi:predicted 2-oxoglutarate/Fe(II)-dependent dioxygenase YbiX